MLKKDYNKVISMYKAGVSKEVCVSALIDLILKEYNNEGMQCPDDKFIVVHKEGFKANITRWVTQFQTDIKAIRSTT